MMSNYIAWTYDSAISYPCKVVECNAYLVGTVGTDGLVLQYQRIRSHNAEYAPMSSQIFMG